MSEVREKKELKPNNKKGERDRKEVYALYREKKKRVFESASFFILYLYLGMFGL
jgi:hypothetical protein